MTVSNANKKSRFFKEYSNEPAKSDDSNDDICNQNLYIGPYSSKNKNTKAVGMEISDEPDENVSFTYCKKGESVIFENAYTRNSLPQYFVDQRVQVRVTPNMGKGCFALEKIVKNTLIESAPVILMHKDTFANLNNITGIAHKLSDYPFSWGRDGLSVLALGYGGIYNHKVLPNLAWRPNYSLESMQYTTVRDIEAGEELFIRYVPLYNLGNLWFQDEESEEYARTHEQKKFEHIEEYLPSLMRITV